jgi:8-oxo-dGTP pyrophosphatase MutT (NUDIX family)
VTFDTDVALLKAGLEVELPGSLAQAHMAPAPPRQWPRGLSPARARDAAGLLLVFPKEETGEVGESAEKKNSLRSPRSPRFLPSGGGDAHIILTVRADGLRHGGQVSLPGGVVDPGETFEQAALREAHEEVALPLEDVHVLGALTPLDIPVSGFRLHPIVAMHPNQPLLTPSDSEVARILEVSVDDLLDRAQLLAEIELALVLLDLDLGLLLHVLHFAADPRDFLQADLMDLLRGKIGRGVMPREERVHLIPPRRLPNADFVVARRHVVAGEEFLEPLVRRDDAGLDRFPCLGSQFRIGR